MEGLLQKARKTEVLGQDEASMRTTLSFESLQERWFQLTDTELLYFKPPTGGRKRRASITDMRGEEAKKGAIALSSILSVGDQLQLKKGETHPGMFQVMVPGRSYLLQATDAAEKGRWIAALLPFASEDADYTAKFLSMEEVQEQEIGDAASFAEYEGDMEKQGGTIKTWKKRHFVLRGRKLYYFDGITAFGELTKHGGTRAESARALAVKQHKGTIDLTVECSAWCTGGDLRLWDGEREWVLKTGSAAEASRWLTEISTAHMRAPNIAGQPPALYVLTSSQRFVLSNGVSLLSIDHEMSMELTSPSELDAAKALPLGEQLVKLQRVVACLGEVALLAGSYLIVATKAEKTTTIKGSPIYRIIGVELLPLFVQRGEGSADASEEQDVFYQRKLTKRLTSGGGENPGGFYLSMQYHITQTMEQVNGLPEKMRVNREPTTELLWTMCDDNFVWNNGFAGRFREHSAVGWVTPIMYGLVDMAEWQPVEAAGTGEFKIEVLLISRRSKNRIGQRYHKRGIDENGNVANFVQTEQVAILGDQRSGGGGRICSLSQVRGSIPLFWKQQGLKYRPVPTLDRDVGAHTAEDDREAFKLHFDELGGGYGAVTAISLVNQEGREDVVGAAFTEAAEQYAEDEEKECESFNYVAWNFHEECKGMTYQNTDKLLEEIDEDIREYGQYMEVDGEQEDAQTGVFRTNCIDCLDRTNVVQLTLARAALVRQLASAGIVTEQEGLPADFLPLYRTMWAKNGDAMSIQYSGTNALKRDFSVTGTRTKMGMAEDGTNSVMRYYKQNFRDDKKQMVMELFEEEQEEDDDDKDTSAYSTAIWAEEQSRTVEEAKNLLPEGEVFVAGWILMSIDKTSHEACRILILTENNLYKGYIEPMVKLKKPLALADISLIEKGYFKTLSGNSRRTAYGFRMLLGSKNMKYRPIVPGVALDSATKALTTDIVNQIMTVQGGITISELAMDESDAAAYRPLTTLHVRLQTRLQDLATNRNGAVPPPHELGVAISTGGAGGPSKSAKAVLPWIAAAFQMTSGGGGKTLGADGFQAALKTLGLEWYDAAKGKERMLGGFLNDPQFTAEMFIAYVLVGYVFGYLKNARGSELQGSPFIAVHKALPFVATLMCVSFSAFDLDNDGVIVKSKAADLAGDGVQHKALGADLFSRQRLIDIEDLTKPGQPAGPGAQFVSFAAFVAAIYGWLLQTPLSAL